MIGKDSGTPDRLSRLRLLLGGRTPVRPGDRHLRERRGAKHTATEPREYRCSALVEDDPAEMDGAVRDSGLVERLHRCTQRREDRHRLSCSQSPLVIEVGRQRRPGQSFEHEAGRLARLDRRDVDEPHDMRGRRCTQRRKLDVDAARGGIGMEDLHEPRVPKRVGTRRRWPCKKERRSRTDGEPSHDPVPRHVVEPRSVQLPRRQPLVLGLSGARWRGCRKTAAVSHPSTVPLEGSRCSVGRTICAEVTLRGACGGGVPLRAPLP